LVEVDSGAGKEHEDKIRLLLLLLLMMMMILMMITTITSVFVSFLLRHTKLLNC
jgi:hypothetical protein